MSFFSILLRTDVLPRHYPAVTNTHQVEPGKPPQHWYCLRAIDTSPSKKTNVYPINMSKYRRTWHSTSSTILRRPGTGGRHDCSLHRRTQAEDTRKYRTAELLKLQEICDNQLAQPLAEFRPFNGIT